MQSTGLDRTRPLILLIMVACAFAGFAAWDPGFISVANLDSIAVFGVEIGMIALGQTLVICGGDAGIDLSVGSIAALSQVALGRLLAAHVAWPVAVAAGVVTGTTLGAINAVAVTAARIPPIIATLATLFAYSGLALVLTGGINIDLTKAPTAFLAIGQSHIAGVPFQLLCLYLPMLALFIYTQHATRFGRALYLAGTNTLAADLAGLRVARLRATAYVVAGLVSAIAGVIDAAWLGTARPDAAADANLVSIAIVVLGGTGIFGGTGSVVGTALASIVIAIIDYGLSYSNFNPIYQAGVIGIVLIATILIENALEMFRASRQVARTSGPPPVTLRNR
jgi:ribose/xylose/arabinose/galactoside ABC-type transport system permease subunit